MDASLSMLSEDTASNTQTTSTSSTTEPLHIDTEDARLAKAIGNLASTMGFDMSLPAEVGSSSSKPGSNRPQSAPVKAASASTNDRPPPVKVDTWMNDENDNVTDNDSKREEVPELSPKPRNADDIIDTRVDKKKEKRESQLRENPDKIVSKYITPQDATLNLDNIDIGRLNCISVD